MPVLQGTLVLNAFIHPWDFQVSYTLPPALFPLVLFRFLAEYVTHHSTYLFLVVPCWMDASWLATVLGMFKKCSSLVHHGKGTSQG